MADQLINARVFQYADDTVIYFPGQETGAIRKALVQDLEALARYFDENELMINLKTEKTEAMPFGTGKRLSATERNLQLRYKGHTINITASYKYLGYTLDACLSLNTFNSAYQRASKRLRPVSKLREYVTSDAAFKIYEETQLARLDSIEKRESEIVGCGNCVSKL